MIRKALLILFTLFLFQACFTPRPSNRFQADEFELLDTLVVTANRSNVAVSETLFRASETLFWDLEHILLDLKFNWENRAINGRASLRLSPYFYEQNKLVLDAKKMDIHSVFINARPVQYNYDGEFLSIPLERVYSRKEQLAVDIVYTTNVWTNVSSVPPFKDNMGVYFIDPEPMASISSPQIWTQGETTYNSFWFPCIDQPNERMTQEIRLTVKNNFSSLSNGYLKEQLLGENGFRTDVWVLEKAHPVYLAAFAIGEFFIASEMHNGVLYQYYVDSSYAENAKAIFAHTPEMLAFFSTITGTPYPWPKYGQVAVKHFVAGAMENTSATIFGNFIQKTDPELYDEPNDAIIAHELFHQWFGNYITCESWANLTLNEGFANYGEYLWAEYKYGKLAAEEIRYGFLMNYLYSSIYQTHPLIHYYYADNEDMFDAHSYDKGALVLHLLRTELGDDAFFEGLKHYTQTHALSSVEIDDLRIAFEYISGKDLRLFFDQWFMASGHPEWSVNMRVDGDSLHIDLHQDQFIDQGFRVYSFPLEILLYDSLGKKQLIRYPVSRAHETFWIPLNDNFMVALIDPERKFLGRMRVNYSLDDIRAIYENTAHPMVRFEAFKSLVHLIQTDSVLCSSFLDDPYYRIRAICIEQLENPDSMILSRIKRLSTEDPHPTVRYAAIKQSSLQADEPWLQELSENMLSEASQRVLLVSFDVFANQALTRGIAPALKYLSGPSFPLQEASFHLLYLNKSTRFLPHMEKALLKRHGEELDSLLKYYVLMAGELGEESRIHARSWLDYQLKLRTKSDVNYKILIKYRQSLL